MATDALVKTQSADRAHSEDSLQLEAFDIKVVMFPMPRGIVHITICTRVPFFSLHAETVAFASCEWQRGRLEKAALTDINYNQRGTVREEVILLSARTHRL